MAHMSRLTPVLNYCVQKVYWVAYRCHLLVNFVLRQSTQGAYVMVWHGDKILLIKNSYKTCFTVPCGGIDEHETPLQAAQRELAEEVGLYLPMEQLEFVDKTLNCSEFKRDTIYWYQAQLSQAYTTKIDNREVIWADFVSLDDALEMPLFAPVAQLLQRQKHSMQLT